MVTNNLFPKHIAIIMDGNGRWAKSRGLPRIAGHKKGAENVRLTLETCVKFGVTHLTIYAFSSENWKRPVKEISELMTLLKFYLRAEIKNLNRNKVKLQVIGDLSKLSNDVKCEIENCVDLTKNNDSINLIIALSYGSRQEITDATRRIVHDIERKILKIDEINEITFSNYLYTSGLPDPDLLIRTGNEIRLSNFLLWQSAYTEFYFSGKFWPDFNEYDLQLAIEDYQKRERRYGNT